MPVTKQENVHHFHLTPTPSIPLAYDLFRTGQSSLQAEEDGRKAAGRQAEEGEHRTAAEGEESCTVREEVLHGRHRRSRHRSGCLGFKSQLMQGKERQ